MLEQLCRFAPLHADLRGKYILPHLYFESCSNYPVTVVNSADKVILQIIGFTLTRRYTDGSGAEVDKTAGPLGLWQMHN